MGGKLDWCSASRCCKRGSGGSPAEKPSRGHSIDAYTNAGLAIGAGLHDWFWGSIKKNQARNAERKRQREEQARQEAEAFRREQEALARERERKAEESKERLLGILKGGGGSGLGLKLDDGEPLTLKGGTNFFGTAGNPEEDIGLKGMGSESDAAADTPKVQYSRVYYLAKMAHQVKYEEEASALATAAFQAAIGGELNFVVPPLDVVGAPVGRDKVDKFVRVRDEYTGAEAQAKEAAWRASDADLAQRVTADAQERAKADPPSAQVKSELAALARSTRAKLKKARAEAAEAERKKKAAEKALREYIAAIEPPAPNRRLVKRKPPKPLPKPKPKPRVETKEIARGRVVLDCAMKQVYLDAQALGPQGEKLAEEIRRDLALKSKAILDGGAGETGIKAEPLLWDYMEDGLQIVVRVGLQRDLETGTLNVDVLSSVTGEDGKEKETQSVLHLDSSGRLVRSEGSPGVMRCARR